MHPDGSFIHAVAEHDRRLTQHARRVDGYTPAATSPHRMGMNSIFQTDHLEFRGFSAPVQAARILLPGTADVNGAHLNGSRGLVARPRVDRDCLPGVWN